MKFFEEDDTLTVNHHNMDALSVDNILYTLSILEQELTIKCAPYYVDHIICYMTPLVKNNLLTAFKRRKMYGKGLPIISRFDEFGRCLPNHKINVMKGTEVVILNAATEHDYYLSFFIKQHDNTSSYSVDGIWDITTEDEDEEDELAADDPF